MMIALKSALLIGAVALTGAQDAQNAVRFIACPIYRDTDNGRKSGCWLADDPASGTRYDVTAAATKPDWNRAILVEGVPAANVGDPCGGMVLEPVVVSVLDQPCTRHMIKAEGYQGRKFALPTRNVRPLYEARQKPAKPYAEGQFTLPFGYRSSFATYQYTDFYLEAALNYAGDVQPARVVIAGHAQTAVNHVSGQPVVEDAHWADARAHMVREAMILRGIPAENITIAPPSSTALKPDVFDGLTTTHDRRVDIWIIPISKGKAAKAQSNR